MLPCILIACFAACYAIAFTFEGMSIISRRGLHGAHVLGFATAGFVLQSAFLVRQVVAFYREAVPNASPLSNFQDWCFVAAWILAVIYLYFAYFHAKTSFGLILLPILLALTGVAVFLADSEPFPREPASKVWGAIHAISILLASVSLLIGFAAGVMYLRQVQRLKHKIPPKKGLRMPSLEWLARTNSQALTVTLITLGIGILSGILLNITNRGREGGYLPWNDPVILTTGLMFLWLLVTNAISLVYRPAREGRRVAYLTVVSFAFLVITLLVVLSKDTEHGGVQTQAGTGFRMEGSGDRDQGSEFTAQGSEITSPRHLVTLSPHHPVLARGGRA
jgi:Cytochrome C assembly protein